MKSNDKLEENCKDINAILDSYLEAALFSSTNIDNDEPLDRYFSVDDISEDTVESSLVDIKAFVKKAGDLLDNYSEQNIGHDFWLTRNHHGAGFWDGDYQDDHGEKLAKISHEFSELCPMVDDSGLIVF